MREKISKKSETRKGIAMWPAGSTIIGQVAYVGHIGTSKRNNWFNNDLDV